MFQSYATSQLMFQICATSKLLFQGYATSQLIFKVMQLPNWSFKVTLLPNWCFQVALLPNWCFKVTLPPNWCFKVTLLPNWCFTLRYFPINAYIKEAMCLPCCGQAGRSGRRKGRCLAASGGIHNASAAAYRAHSPHTPYCSSETIYKVNAFHTYGWGTSASEREQNLQHKELTT